MPFEYSQRGFSMKYISWFFLLLFSTSVVADNSQLLGSWSDACLRPQVCGGAVEEDFRRELLMDRFDLKHSRRSLEHPAPGER